MAEICLKLNALCLGFESKYIHTFVKKLTKIEDLIHIKNNLALLELSNIHKIVNQEEH
jgi:hypothetical protein